MTGADELVEVPGDRRGVSFSRESLDRLLELAASGDRAAGAEQDAAVGSPAATSS